MCGYCRLNVKTTSVLVVISWNGARSERHSLLQVSSNTTGRSTLALKRSLAKIHVGFFASYVHTAHTRIDFARHVTVPVRNEQLCRMADAAGQCEASGFRIILSHRRLGAMSH